MTSEIIESLNNCQVERAPLKTIDVMKWPRGLKVVTCMSSAIFKTKEELEILARKKYLATKKWSDKERSLETKVVISRVDLRWFKQEDKNLFAFVKLLENLPISFYSTEFIELLIEEFFKDA